MFSIFFCFDWFFLALFSYFPFVKIVQQILQFFFNKSSDLLKKHQYHIWSKHSRIKLSVHQRQHLYIWIEIVCAWKGHLRTWSSSILDKQDVVERFDLMHSHLHHCRSFHDHANTPRSFHIPNLSKLRKTNTKTKPQQSEIQIEITPSFYRGAICAPWPERPRAFVARQYGPLKQHCNCKMSFLLRRRVRKCAESVRRKFNREIKRDRLWKISNVFEYKSRCETVIYVCFFDSW